MNRCLPPSLTLRFTSKQQERVVDLCAEFRSVSSVCVQEFDTCTVSEVNFPLPLDARPVDCSPYHSNPRTCSLINNWVKGMQELEVIEERPGAWGLPCCIVAKKNASPRFCVDYRHALNKHLRSSWPILNMNSCLDTVGGAKYTSVADMVGAFWSLSVAAEDVDKTVHVFRCNVSAVIVQRMISVLLDYINDLSRFSSTFEVSMKSL